MLLLARCSLEGLIEILLKKHSANKFSMLCQKKSIQSGKIEICFTNLSEENWPVSLVLARQDQALRL